MTEPMDEDNTSQVPGLTLEQDAPSETMATASGSSSIGSRRDRVQRLLETILMTFRLEFKSLPSEAQQAYSRFQENKSYPEFAAELKRLLLRRKLYTFMGESTAFLQAVTDLFDSRYPYLGLRELLDEKEGRGKKDVSERYPFGRSSKSRRHVKGAARHHGQTQRASDGSEPSAKVGLARTLTMSSRSRQLKRQQGRVLDWTRVELPSSPQAPQAAAGPSTTASAMNFGAARSTQDSETADNQGTQPVTGRRLPTPSFMISTRSRPGSRDDHEHDTEASGGAKPLAEFNAAWLRNFINSRGGPKADFNLYPYKGWKIEQPKVLLHRARNFLADEDIDRTLDWSQKFAELVEYFSYLLHNWQGEDWGVELQEVIDMLQTHWLFEQYHYGQPKLNLKFDTEWPIETKRLPPLLGVEYIAGKRDEPKDDKGERRLLLNKIRPAIDVHYKLPSDLLKKYVDVYASEAPFFWGFAPDSVSPRRELVKLENNAFEKCVFSDMSTTATNIEANESKFKLECDKEHFSSDALRTFAKLRGTRRAAIQQTLNHLDNAENMAVCNAWRTLILPPPKVPEQPDAGIILPVMQVANIPEKEARDPFSYTLGHKWFLQAERYWADWTREHSIKEAHGHKLWEQREAPVMDLPLNFRGPWVQNSMDSEMKKTLTLLKTCETLRERISIQKKVTKRQFLSDVVSSILKGLTGKHWREMEMPFKTEDFIPGSEDLAYIRPKEEDFLQLLGEPSMTQGACVDLRTEYKDYALIPEDGPRSKIFQQRAENVFFGKGTKHRSRYDLDDFLVEINRDCGGPVQRWRFSKEEAIEELELLEEKLMFGLDEDDDTVFCIKPDVHPEQRVRWLDTDQDMDAYMQAMKSSKGKASSDNDEAKDKDEVETMSTDVSVPESEDLGDYMFGLPKIENLRSWQETCNDDDDECGIDDDMPKTLEFYKRLGFRLGKTIHDLRAKHETQIRQLTPLQQELNNRFLRDIVDFWEDDAVRRPNEPRNNPNKVGSKGVNRPTPFYRDVVKMAEPEAYDKSWKGSDLSESSGEKKTALALIRKGIIREACENKSMLFPNRIDRHINEKGETVEVPRRHEPVWSFAHPERRGKIPRLWDINRWPLHLQAERKGGNQYSFETIDYTPRMQLISRSMRKEARSPVATAPKLRVKPRAQRERKLEPTPGTSTDVTENMDTTKDQSQSIPGLGDEFTVTFGDMAQSRRTFRPGPAQYWLGDTPLQRKLVERSLRSGIESAPTPTWRQRLAALFGRREEIEADPTALPEVDPRDILKSRPRSESSEEQDDESVEEDMPDVEEVVEGTTQDVEMEDTQGIATRFRDESEAGPSTSPAPLGSPMVAAFEPTPYAPQMPITPTLPRIHPTTGEHLTGTAERAFRGLRLGPWSTRPRSRPLKSCRLDLTIEEPTQSPPVEPERDEEEEALRRALYESD